MAVSWRWSSAYPTEVRWRSKFPIPARELHHLSCLTSSIRSSAARGRGSAWVWRSRGGSPRTTAVASRRRTGPTAGRASCSVFRPSRMTRNGLPGPSEESAMPTLLVIDDEEPILHFFRRAFHGPEVNLVTAASAAEGVERVTLRSARRGHPGHRPAGPVRPGGVPRGSISSFPRSLSSSSPGMGPPPPPSRR